MAKLPAMWPRVVVAEHLGDPTQREQVFASLVTLEESRVLEELRRFLTVECGALKRQNATMPAAVKRAARSALQVFAVLEQAVSGATMWSLMREAKSPNTDGAGANVLQDLQRLMDQVFEAQSAFDREARVLVAGIGGCDLAGLRPFHATSGFEAVVNLADNVRRTVRGVLVSPLNGFVRAKNNTGTRRQQTGREKPVRPEDTESRDVAILRAMADGAVGRAVAARTNEFGFPCSESHVRKRRMDLRRWGWITSDRNATLTDEGRAWLSEIPARGTTTRNPQMD